MVPRAATSWRMLRELKMPVVTTFHTILHEPRTDQRRVTEEL